MSKPAIKVEGLWKEYQVGHAHERHGTFYDLLASTVKAPLKRLRSLAGDAEDIEKFWALRDINFEVQPGEVVGIIGRNGAGKSTLLKILSRITAPTKGKIEVRGRLASLLEVGTGFHPELSGRENIFLNGAILGMTRKEVARKFDEIVAFAEIEKFIDTPVKRYSSGMYVRLAFAVAAHLEPDILVVDEVLAVGDVDFQRKCIGKMGEVSGHGRTVLFVSHNMGAVRRLCSKAVVLREGEVSFIGDVMKAVSHHTINEDVNQQGSSIDLTASLRKGNERVIIEKIDFPDCPSVAHGYRVFEKVRIRFQLKARDEADMAFASVWFLFRNANGDDVLMLMQKDSGIKLQPSGKSTLDMVIENILAPGRYSIACGILGHGKEIWDWVDDAGVFEVEEAIEGIGQHDSRLGLVTAKAEWLKVEHTPAC